MVEDGLTTTTVTTLMGRHSGLHKSIDTFCLESIKNARVDYAVHYLALTDFASAGVLEYSGLAKGKHGIFVAEKKVFQPILFSRDRV
jgi:hypothetical protein